MFSSQNYGSPVFWTSHEPPEPRLLNPSGAFNDPFYPSDSGEEPLLLCLLEGRFRVEAVAE
jgi:hypothetical protein